MTETMETVSMTETIVVSLIFVTAMILVVFDQMKWRKQRKELSSQERKLADSSPSMQAVFQGRNFGERRPLVTAAIMVIVAILFALVHALYISFGILCIAAVIPLGALTKRIRPNHNFHALWSQVMFGSVALLGVLSIAYEFARYH